MRTIFWFLYFWASLVCLIPRMYLVKKGWERKDVQTQKRIEDTVANWARQLLFLAGVSVDVEGLENIPKGAAIFACNHQGNFDIPIALTCLNKVHPILAKAELQKLPLVRTWMKYIYCIFLDRHDARKAAAAVKEAAGLLSAGHSMVIFPEGTRSKGPQMGEFKAGAFRIGGKLGIPIVPVCLEGSYKVMEQQGFWIRPALVHVRILPPIVTDNLSREESKMLGEIVARQIADVKRELT